MGACTFLVPHRWTKPRIDVNRPRDSDAGSVYPGLVSPSFDHVFLIPTLPPVSNPSAVCVLTELIGASSCIPFAHTKLRLRRRVPRCGGKDGEPSFRECFHFSPPMRTPRHQHPIVIHKDSNTAPQVRARARSFAAPSSVALCIPKSVCFRGVTPTLG